MLEVDNLSYRTGRRQILKEMTLQVEDGEIVGVLVKMVLVKQRLCVH
ncbi:MULTISPECIES: hypothetical protein [Weissella]|uniref:Uncharacterized protein n=1 Tax=Weissella fermenti TaxID=2987699 RepID=A0ABT6D3L5_9LACO|nr:MULTISPECIES: hypothetical protein [Weissella]MCW0927512.1 hypothetical protein [Weissella sp. LMG 11983]MDF9299967.1 hypothetical protein [Weissella sp. BK2]